ncbi:MAG: TatD family deoxyribonuclease [Ruminococcaceae bacterium]|nr:TatD family deoxyribonuclease [Oscillospiraceae bacterium]
MSNTAYIYDTHAHYDSSRFDEDRNEVLSAMAEANVGCIINCGCDMESSRISVQLAEQYPFVYAAVGFHPHEADTWNENSEAELRELLKHPRVVALGEIGLDYHYDFSPRELQQEVMEKQLVIAKEMGVPIIIHDREAHGDMYALLRRFAPLCGVMHCFSGSAELARESVSMGLHIGLGGAVTFKNAVHPLEVAAYVPADRLLLETDSPYMTPVPHRGKRCDSRMIAHTAQRIAEVRGVSYEELLEQTARNAERLFGAGAAGTINQ